MPDLKHIAVCVCTFQRPDLLLRLLEGVGKQETKGLFTYSIVVVDNDRSRSAEPVVEAFRKVSAIEVVYCVEPEQNIPRARNRAVENAKGDFIAFLDDDEFPTDTWLHTLFTAYEKYQVDGVLGPVKRHFDQTPPGWVLKSDFYERATYPTGLIIDWRKGRTGNVLLSTQLFKAGEDAFNPVFRQGEDQDFFRRKIEAGHKFVWCNEAAVFEVVPPIRWNRTFMLRRALLRGALEPKMAGFGFKSIAKSLVAIPVYTVMLPFALVVGQHKFMKLLVSLCDHVGKILASMGINPVGEPYVTQ